MIHFLDSCSWTFEEKASLPCLASFETENESFNANLCRNHWIKSNESSDFVQIGHHNRSRFPHRTTRKENWTWNANVNDANDASCSRATNGLWTTYYPSYS
jgi:hypothetical protein